MPNPLERGCDSVSWPVAIGLWLASIALGAAAAWAVDLPSLLESVVDVLPGVR